MTEKTYIDGITKHVKDHAHIIEHNQIIFEILEGNMIKHLEKKLSYQIKGESLWDAMKRATPINVLKKIVQKLSKIYLVAPTRKASVQDQFGKLEPNDSDNELMSSYETKLDINSHFNDANENFNSYKNTSIEIYLDEEAQELKVRSNPSNRFIVRSTNPSNPLDVTEYIKFMGQKDGKAVFWVYTNDEFIPINEEGQVITEHLAETEGINEFGIIPATYISRSRYLLIPLADSDTVQMTLLFPVLLTDVNFISLYQSFPIIYGINLDLENVTIGPNVILNLKSSQDGEKPEFKVLKPDADIQQLINSIKEQLSFWLETRNIRPGSIGSTTAENFSSGISLIIANADTTQDRMTQELYFKEGERDFWRRLAIIHNKLAKEGKLKDKRSFSNPENLHVTVLYADQKPIESKNDLVNRLKLEVDAGFNSKKNAIKELNNEISDTEIDELIKEIDEEKLAFGGLNDEKTNVQSENKQGLFDIAKEGDRPRDN